MSGPIYETLINAAVKGNVRLFSMSICYNGSLAVVDAIPSVWRLLIQKIRSMLTTKTSECRHSGVLMTLNWSDMCLVLQAQTKPLKGAEHSTDTGGQFNE